MQAFQECLRIRRVIYGSAAHVDIATALKELGKAARGAGSLSEAMLFFKEQRHVLCSLAEDHGLSQRLRSDLEANLQWLRTIARDMGDRAKVKALNEEITAAQSEASEALRSNEGGTEPETALETAREPVIAVVLNHRRIVRQHARAVQQGDLSLEDLPTALRPSVEPLRAAAVELEPLGIGNPSCVELSSNVHDVISAIHGNHPEEDVGPVSVDQIYRACDALRRTLRALRVKVAD